jgi:hypothetical protein
VPGANSAGGSSDTFVAALRATAMGSMPDAAQAMAEANPLRPSASRQTTFMKASETRSDNRTPCQPATAVISAQHLQPARCMKPAAAAHAAFAITAVPLVLADAVSALAA